jgi:hypothetical protein
MHLTDTASFEFPLLAWLLGGMVLVGALAFFSFKGPKESNEDQFDSGEHLFLGLLGLTLIISGLFTEYASRVEFSELFYEEVPERFVTMITPAPEVEREPLGASADESPGDSPDKETDADTDANTGSNAASDSDADLHQGTQPEASTSLGPAGFRLLELTRQGELPVEALEDAILEQASQSLGLEEAFLRADLLPWMEAAGRITKQRNLAPPQALAALKAHLYNTRSLQYEVAASNPGHLADGRLQCNSGSIVVMWAALRAGLDRAEGRWVFVHTKGHVRPGWLTNTELHGVEATVLGESVISGSLEELDELAAMRVLSTRESLALALLGKDAPAWLEERVLLWKSAREETISSQADLLECRESETHSSFNLPGGFGKVDVPPGLQPLGTAKDARWEEAIENLQGVQYSLRVAREALEEDREVDVLISQLLGTPNANNSGETTQDHFANLDFEGQDADALLRNAQRMESSASLNEEPAANPDEAKGQTANAILEATVALGSPIFDPVPPDLLQVNIGIKRELKRYIGRLKLCYKQALRGEPNLMGRIDIKFSVGRGRVLEAFVVKNSTHNDDLAQCVLRKIKGLTFEQMIEADVIYPFIFSLK